MFAAFDRLSETPTLDRLPIRMQQTNSPAATAWRLLLLSPAVVLLAVPMLIGAHLAGEPAALAAVSDHPAAAIQAVVGFMLWALLLAVPLGQAVRRMGARRTVEIGSEAVEVVETTVLGTRRWREPLSSYRGIAHHVRTSMSGVRHELVLVHPRPSRHVLLTVQDRISQSALEDAKALLDLPELPARAIYDRAPAAAGRLVGADPSLAPATG